MSYDTNQKILSDELRHRSNIKRKNILKVKVAPECAHIPNHQRVWEDLPANEYSRGYTWETQVSNLISKTGTT